MSPASRSVNWMAFFSSSPSLWSMLPSCWTSSTSIRSSAWERRLSGRSRKRRESRRFHWEKRKFSGVKAHIRKRSIGAEKQAKRSAQSRATLLGEISPKISTASVTTTVEREAPASPKRWTKSSVPREAVAMFTILLPMRMVEIRRSYWPWRCRASSARRSPCSARVLILAVLREEKAVSVAEK